MVVSKQLHSRARQREVTCGPRLLRCIPFQGVLNRPIEVYRCFGLDNQQMPVHLGQPFPVWPQSWQRWPRCGEQGERFNPSSF